MSSIASAEGRVGRLLVRSATEPGKPVTRALSVTALIMAAAFVDWVTGPDLSLLIVYFVVTLAAAWGLSGRAGGGAAFFASMATISVGLWHPDAHATEFVVLLNGTFRFVVLGSVAYGSMLLRRTLSDLDRVARTDPLTGLLNRRALFEGAEHERERARRRTSPLTVAYVDLDGLKGINDTVGHEAGDELIQRFADALRSDLRTVDLVARMGGDEFVVVMPDTDGEQAATALSRLREHPGIPAASIGAVCWMEEPPAVRDMVIAADELMYATKQRRLSLQVQVATPGSRSKPL